MAKYELIVVKETKRDFLQNYILYYENLLKLIQEYKKQTCKLFIGTKHITIKDNQNDLELHKETPPSIKDFKNFCETKGYRFIKK